MTDFDGSAFARWLDDGGAHRAVAAVLDGDWVVDGEGVQNVQPGSIVPTVRTLTAAPSVLAGFADRVMAEVAIASPHALSMRAPRP